jgi:hypothetical protein
MSSSNSALMALTCMHPSYMEQLTKIGNISELEEEHEILF